MLFLFLLLWTYTVSIHADSYRYVQTLPSFESFYIAEFGTNISINCTNTTMMLRIEEQNINLDFWNDNDWNEVIKIFPTASTSTRRLLEDPILDAAAAAASQTANDGTSSVTKVYEGIATPKSWQEADKMCKFRQAQLASISSGSQNYQVMQECNTLGRDYSCWVGLKSPFGSWSNGSKAKYTNWIPGYPEGRGDCTQMYPDGKWGDESCEEKRAFVCEKTEKGPPSVAIKTYLKSHPQTMGNHNSNMMTTGSMRGINQMGMGGMNGMNGMNNMNPMAMGMGMGMSSCNNNHYGQMSQCGGCMMMNGCGQCGSSCGRERRRRRERRRDRERRRKERERRRRERRHWRKRLARLRERKDAQLRHSLEKLKEKHAREANTYEWIARLLHQKVKHNMRKKQRRLLINDGDVVENDAIRRCKVMKNVKICINFHFGQTWMILDVENSEIRMEKDGYYDEYEFDLYAFDGNDSRKCIGEIDGLSNEVCVETVVLDSGNVETFLYIGQNALSVDDDAAWDTIDQIHFKYEDSDMIKKCIYSEVGRDNRICIERFDKYHHSVSVRSQAV